MTTRDEMVRSANRLAKWRTIFAGWWLGTRPKSDPQAQAVRDMAERTLLMRAEVSGLTRLLIESGVVTEEKVLAVFREEYDALEEQLQHRFPGAKAMDFGMQIDPEVFAETTRGWLP